MIKYTRKRYLTTLLSLMICTVSFSQYHVLGNVFTGSNKELVSGNILLYKAVDSSFIIGGMIVNGKFDVSPVKEKEVIIKIRSLETKDYYQTISNPDENSNINIGEIILENREMLAEVEVLGFVPLYEIDGTTTKVNVQNTLLAESITPLEILKRSPGVQVSDNNVSVIGRGSTIIYADGQQINVDQLNMIPVDQIIRIEIIKDPSSKYGSEAGAVINVVTKSYYREGFQVSLRQAFLMPTFVSSSNLSVNFEQKKWLVQASYSGTQGNSWNTAERRTERKALFKTELDLLENSRVQKHNGNFGVSYKIDSNSRFTIEYSGSIAKIDVNVASKNKVFANQLTEYEASNNGIVSIVNNSLLANYKKSLDTLGSSFFVGAQYSGYSLGLDENISENITINSIATGNRQRVITSNNWINLFSGQADYQKFVSPSWSVSSGVRFSNSINRGDLNMNNRIDEQLEFVPNYSSTTQFTEQLLAFYAETNKQMGTFDFRAGVRLERTMAEGITTQENQQSLNRTYNWVIPSILFSKKLNKHFTLNLSYNINTGRPSYNDLDPKIFYVDSLTSKQGNPLLLPQMDHSIKLAGNIGNLQIDATYYRSINAFKNITKEGISGQNSVILYKENVDADRFYTSLTIPVQNKFVSAYFNYSVNWDKVIGEFGDFSAISLKPNHYLYLYAQIKMKRFVNIEFISNYFSGRYDGIYQDLSSYSISLGISKSFLNDQLKCSILANDMLFSEREAGTYFVDDYSVSYLDQSYTQYIRFSLNYSFGKLKEQSYKAVDVGAEEKRRIK